MLSKYIRLTTAYLTTARQVITKVFYFHMKRLVTTLNRLNTFIFTVNYRTSWHVYTTASNGRVARSV